jgi:signal transduction histidine kinase/CheY-like chemotaxis protein/PAS domain-containing protein
MLERCKGLLRLSDEAQGVLLVVRDATGRIVDGEWLDVTAPLATEFPQAEAVTLLSTTTDQRLLAVLPLLQNTIENSQPEPPPPGGWQLYPLGEDEWLVRWRAVRRSPVSALCPAMRAVLRAAPGGVVVVAPDGRIVDSNRAARRMFSGALAAAGKTVDEALRRVMILDENGKPVDPAAAVCWDRLLAGESVRGQVLGIVVPGKQDPPVRWLEVHMVPLRAAAKSAVSEIVFSFSDITALRNAELRIVHLVRGLSPKAASEFLSDCVRHLAESMGAQYALVGRYVAGETDRIQCPATYMNGEVVDSFEYAMAGTPCEQVVGRQLCLFRGNVQALFPQDSLLSELGVEAYMGLPLSTALGEPLGLIAVMWKEPLRECQQFESLLQVFASRAAAELERKQAEEGLRTMIVELGEQRRKAEAASRAKSEFLATLSHEIRTPLNAIIGTADLLRTTPLDNDQMADLTVLRESADSLLGLIDDLLDLSRIEADRLRPERAEFSLRGLLARVGRVVQMQAERKRLVFAVALDDRLPDRVIGDEVRIGQILTNLLGNAVKFTQSGSVIMRCDLKRMEANWAEVCWEVADTGVGIPPEIQAQIFEPFVQGDASFTRRFGGTGLGLAISRRLTHLLGGSIDFSSVAGEGSVFRFCLPLTLAEEVQSGVTLAPETVRLTGNPRILLVEDNVVNQRVGQRLLERLGCQVDIAADGAQALERLVTVPYQVILMDCQMPVMDGFQATYSLRRRGGPNGRTVIIALTANAMAGDRERCLLAGMNDYMRKPITLADLTTVLARWLPTHVACVE